MKAQLALCMKYMPAACMKSLTLTHEGWEFVGECGLATAVEIPLARIEIGPGVPSKSARQAVEIAARSSGGSRV